MVIDRIGFEGLKAATMNSSTVEELEFKYIGFDETFTADEFVMLKDFFSNSLVTYETFRREVLPQIKELEDPFTKDREILRAMPELWDWSLGEVKKFEDITEEYTDELQKLGWRKIEQLPGEYEEKAMRRKLPTQKVWVEIWEHYRMIPEFSYTEFERKPVHDARGKIVEYRDFPKQVGETPLPLGDYAVVTKTRRGIFNLYIF